MTEKEVLFLFEELNALLKYTCKEARSINHTWPTFIPLNFPARIKRLRY